MRRLFTPALCLLSVFALPLAGCDSNDTQSALAGDWALVRVADQAGLDVLGPVGSTLTFREDGTFEIESVNDCAGTYTSEFVVNTQILDFPTRACTEIATTPGDDLVALLGLPRSDVFLEYVLFASEPARLEIRASTPEADRVLVFTSE